MTRHRKCYTCNAPACDEPGMVGAMAAREFCAHCLALALEELRMAHLPTQERIRRRMRGMSPSPRREEVR